MVGSDVLFWAGKDERSRAYIYHDDTGTIEPYLDAVGMDIVGFWTDGVTLVWIQSAPPYTVAEVPTVVELWSSPYSSDPAELVPARVVELGPSFRHPEHRYESGLVVLRDSQWDPATQAVSWSRDYVIRLRDRVYWSIEAPDGLWWGDILYAAADEIAMAVQPAHDQTRTSTVRRQRLPALGTPQPLGTSLLEP